MQAAKPPGQLAGAPPRQAGDSGLFSWTAAADSGTPSLRSPARAPPGGSTRPRAAGKGAGWEPTCAPRARPGDPAHRRGRSWPRPPWHRWSGPQCPGGARGAGGPIPGRPRAPACRQGRGPACVTGRPALRPLPAQTPPRGKAVRIKAWGPPARPQTCPATARRARTWVHSRLLRPRTSRVRSSKRRRRRRGCC